MAAITDSLKSFFQRRLVTPRRPEKWPGLRPEMQIRYCARLFKNFGISHAPVVDNGKIVSFYLLVLHSILPELE